MRAKLITFFGESKVDDGRRLVGIGLTDSMIEVIKKQGIVLEPTERTNQGSDVVVVYAPTVEGVVRILSEFIGEDHLVIKEL
jgi:hypothetical protein